MINSLIKCLGLALLSGYFVACSNTNNKPLLIGFSVDGSSIEIKNIDPAGLLELKSLKQRDSTLNNLIYVLQTPSEKDSLIKEMPITGLRKITDSSVVFIPDLPFVKNRDYIVTTFINADFGDAGKMLKGKLSYGVKPYSKTLTR